MAKDTNRLELTKQVQDKKFRGVNLKTGERGFVNSQKNVLMIRMERHLAKVLFLQDGKN